MVVFHGQMPCRLWTFSVLLATLVAPCASLQPAYTEAQTVKAGERRHRPMRGSKAKAALAPTYFGLPIYYEGRVPPHFFNMSYSAKQDYYYRIEKWHSLLEEGKAEGCRAPTPGDKVVYFIQHGEMMANELGRVGSEQEKDGLLCVVGVEQSQNLRIDPMLNRALSGSLQEQAQVIIVSPARKAMQTAILGLASALPNATWSLSPDIIGFGLEGVHGKLLPHVGSAMLREMGQVQLLRLYDGMRAGWDQDLRDGKKKWSDFVQHLLSRPEKRIIVVTHKEVAKFAGFSKMHSGEVRIAKLLPDGKFTILSPPDCWPSSA